VDVLAIVSDTHANSRLGLCVPSFNLLDGGTYRANRTQRWLWNNWLEFWQEFDALEGRKGAIFNGDMIDGDSKKRSYQTITNNPAEMVDLANLVLLPALDVLDYCVFLKGTPAHVGKSANLEETLARDVTIAELNGENNYAWDNFYGEVGGVVFDIKHHGKLGHKPWTRPNSINALAVELVLAYTKRRERLPDVAIRSHRHLMADSYDNYAVRVIANGCWQMQNEYGHVVSDDLPDISGLIFECENGEYELTKKSYIPGRRKLWTNTP